MRKGLEVFRGGRPEKSLQCRVSTEGTGVKIPEGDGWGDTVRVKRDKLKY